jgi:hypothetical protein
MARAFEDITTAELESLRSLKDGSRWEVPPHHKERLIEAGYIADVGGHHQLTKAAITRVARGK